MSNIYFLRRPEGIGPIKVGYSRWPVKRLQACMAWSPYELAIIALLPVPLSDRPKGLHYIERQFHQRYLGWRLHHEWHEPAALILSDVAEIDGGTFNLGCLPEPSIGVLPPNGHCGEVVIAARAKARRDAWAAAHTREAAEGPREAASQAEKAA